MSKRPDPIFAAIAKYRQTLPLIKVTAEAVDEHHQRHTRSPHSAAAKVRERKLRQRDKRAMNAHMRAIYQFCRTRPTTPAGAAAALRFIEESYRKGDFLLSDDDRSGIFYRTLRKALERMAA